MAAAICRRCSAPKAGRRRPVPEEPFRAGQVVVVQPNVVTKDRKAGVQTGEMLLITETGVERVSLASRAGLR